MTRGELPPLSPSTTPDSFDHWLTANTVAGFLLMVLLVGIAVAGKTPSTTDPMLARSEASPLDDHGAPTLHAHP